MTNVLARTARGLYLYEEFARSDRTLAGDRSWVVNTAGPNDYDAGTWAIASGLTRNTTAANYDRTHWEADAALNVTVEARLRTPTPASIAFGTRWGVQAGSGLTDYEVLVRSSSLIIDANVNGTRSNIVSDTSPGTLTTNQWYTLRSVFTYGGARALAVLLDGTTLWSGAPGAGPTTAGWVGLIAYGGQADCDRIAAWQGQVLTVTGLTGTQAFRVFDASGTVVASSGAQSGGSATVTFSNSQALPLTGYLQVYTATTWATAEADLRWPVAGTQPDICGGDTYAVQAAQARAGLKIDVNWTDTTDWPTMWEQDYGTLPCPERVTIRERAGAPEGLSGFAEIVCDNAAHVYSPANVTSPLFPNVERLRPLRVLAEYAGAYYPLFYGVTNSSQPLAGLPAKVVIQAQGVMAEMWNTTVTMGGTGTTPVSGAGTSLIGSLLSGYSGVATPQHMDIPTTAQDLDVNGAQAPGWWNSTHAVSTFLTDLLDFSMDVAAITPRYRITATDTDFMFRWRTRAALAARGDVRAFGVDGDDLHDIRATYGRPGQRTVTTLPSGASSSAQALLAIVLRKRQDCPAALLRPTLGDRIALTSLDYDCTARPMIVTGIDYDIVASANPLAFTFDATYYVKPFSTSASGVCQWDSGVWDLDVWGA